MFPLHFTVSPARQVTDCLAPGQRVGHPPGVRLLGVERGHGQVRRRLEMILSCDVNMVSRHGLHQGWTRAGSHQPGHVGGALVPPSTEGVSLVCRGRAGQVGCEDIPSGRNVLITHC